MNQTVGLEGAQQPGAVGELREGSGGLWVIRRRPEASPAMINRVCCQSRLGNILHQKHWSDFAVTPSTANIASWYTDVREMRTEEFSAH